jgi:hypothetical protein
VQPTQDNRSNVVKKLEKRQPAPKIASQSSKKQVQNDKDEKVEYVRSVFLNARSLMLLMFLICHTIILMLLMCL